ncbi:MAG: glycosyltransferase [Chitinispirillaceae bacterium]|nr:glycosyltransferase [Chitinispirillaceae bacterium]
MTARSTMLISGFSFARNADKLEYPVVESIRSILPVCDEFVITVGRGDDGDTTRSLVASIGDPKIRILDTEWTALEQLRSRIYSQQTNIALGECRGMWCFYLQADEIVHEQYLASIREACGYFADRREVDGFLFRYKHFWGDYDHYLVNHRWYPREIRIVRNGRGIVSVGDAQSFRYGDGKKVPVVALDAEIFHYGHVRDPHRVHIRKKAAARIYRGDLLSGGPCAAPPPFDYGSLEKLPYYRGTYPAVMRERIAAMDWRDLLQYRGKSRVALRHDRLKYRFLTLVEQKIFRGSGREFWGYKPYRVLRGLSRRYARMRKGLPGAAASGGSPGGAGTAPAAALIIAVYDRPDFLEKVFCSLKNQTATDFEIIIADDGSGPSIAELVERYQGTFRRPVKHVRHDDDGFRKTIIVNRAVVAAEAPYCIFIDGDCLLHHRFIEFHLKRKRRGSVLSGRRVMMNAEVSVKVSLEDVAARRIEKRGYWWGKCNKAGYRHGFFIPGMFHLKNIVKRKTHDILGSNFSVYKDDFLLINGYDERIVGRGMEDDNLSIRFSMAGIPVKTVCHEALQYHLYHTSVPMRFSDEFSNRFRNNPEAARTPFGIVRERREG